MRWMNRRASRAAAATVVIGTVVAAAWTGHSQEPEAPRPVSDAQELSELFAPAIPDLPQRPLIPPVTTTRPRDVKEDQPLEEQEDIPASASSPPDLVASDIKGISTMGEALQHFIGFIYQREQGNEFVQIVRVTEDVVILRSVYRRIDNTIQPGDAVHVVPIERFEGLALRRKFVAGAFRLVSDTLRAR